MSQISLAAAIDDFSVHIVHVFERGITPPFYIVEVCPAGRSTPLNRMITLRACHRCGQTAQHCVDQRTHPSRGHFLRRARPPAAATAPHNRRRFARPSSWPSSRAIPINSAVMVLAIDAELVQSPGLMASPVPFHDDTVVVDDQRRR